MHTELIASPIGLLEVQVSQSLIYGIKLRLGTDDGPTAPSKVSKVINYYFKGKRKRFGLTCVISGTPFQKKVWRAIAKIPYGQTRTYAQVAKQIGYPRAYRAVANACGRNKHALIIPCHRVVSSNGLGGYEWGLQRKRWLLDHEKKHATGTNMD